MKKPLTNSEIIEILKIQMERWKYQNTKFWSILIKITIINYLIILFPFVYDIFGIDMGEINLPLAIFPIFGILLSILFFYINISAYGRQLGLSKALDNTIDYFELDCIRKVRFPDMERIKFRWLTKQRMGYSIAFGNLFIQWTLAILIVYLLNR